jgi:simple sugar transport system permease protein
MKKMLKKNEFYILLTIVALCLLIELRSGQFFTGNNIIDILRSLVIPGMFSVGAFIVLVSGGIDVSFPALASLVSYATSKMLVDMGFEGPVIVPYLIGIAMGIALGALNGLFISIFRLPALIVTLGTQSVYRGIMQGVLNSVQISEDMLPPSMPRFGYSSLFTGVNPETGLTSEMPTTFIIFIVVVIGVAIFLRYTMSGRGIFAIGGDETSAIRAGFRVKLIKFMIYCFVGALAGAAGITRVCMMKMCHPTNLLGMEMTVIAAVVLGGTSITGGTGTIWGAMLGILLLTIVQNSLILLGIPTFWQELFTGTLILLGTGISAYRAIRDSRKLPGLRDA